MKHCSVLIFLFASIIISGCNNKAKLIGKISNMKATPIVLHFDDMENLGQDSLSLNCLKNANLKYIIYSDSNQCTQCYLNKLAQWNELLELENQSLGKFQFVFIIEPKINETEIIKKWFPHSNLNHSVYIDKSSTLKRNNPIIPIEPLFHCFLIDETNKIVIVGDPLHNGEIREMLFKLLLERKYIP